MFCQPILQDLSRSALDNCSSWVWKCILRPWSRRSNPARFASAKREMKAAVILWAAGVAASPLGKNWARLWIARDGCW